MKVTESVIGERDGKQVVKHTITNDSGMELVSMNYGCTIMKLTVPDRNGKLENIVLGFDQLEEYEQSSPYFGSIVGRHAGRIADGRFELDGVQYELAVNNGSNHLHGGIKGFDKVVWDVEVQEESDQVRLSYQYTSTDGEEGYPGTIQVTVHYTLTNNNEVLLAYEGLSDARTILNMTNHTYFNLSGDLKHTIVDHQLTLKSDRYVELSANLLPTGQLLSVDDTVFDFREGRKISDGMVSDDEQNVLAGNGYDHPFMLADHLAEEIVLVDEESGRKLTVETNQPAVVLYAGTQLEDHYLIQGRRSEKYLGLCLETQGVPDAIHHPQFPTTVVEANAPYLSQTKWSFGVIK